jgi:hypothetical protein
VSGTNLRGESGFHVDTLDLYQARQRSFRHALRNRRVSPATLALSAGDRGAAGVPGRSAGRR